LPSARSASASERGTDRLHPDHDRGKPAGRFKAWSSSSTGSTIATTASTTRNQAVLKPEHVLNREIGGGQGGERGTERQ